MSRIDKSQENTCARMRNTALEIETTKILISLGITSQYRAFSYLRTAIILTYYNPDITDYITKTLYPKVKRLCAAESSTGVERTCRRAVAHICNEKYANILHKYFDFDTNIPISCAGFISGIAEYLHKVI